MDCADQAEVDDYWDKLVKAGATPTACGWIKDPFGLSWQIVPRRFTELIRDANPNKVKAVMDAMMTMVKLDVAGLERAYDGLSRDRLMTRHEFVVKWLVEAVAVGAWWGSANVATSTLRWYQFGWVETHPTTSYGFVVRRAHHERRWPGATARPRLLERYLGEAS
ncbi:MAG: VOC family protein [Burkholderiales bacterium]